MVFFSCGDLLLLGAVVRVDGVLEAHEHDKNVSLPLAPLESSDQVRNYSIFKITIANLISKCVRREASSIGELNQAITIREWLTTTAGNRFGCKLDIFEPGAELGCAAFVASFEVFVAYNAFEGGASAKRPLFDDCELLGEGGAHEGRTVLECVIANNFEFFVVDDALEGGAMGKYPRIELFELIGESDTREGVAPSECSHSYIHNVAVLTEYHTHEVVTFSERKPLNALEFGASGEVNSKEGGEPAERCPPLPPNCSEVGSPQVELYGAVGEAHIQQPTQQSL